VPVRWSVDFVQDTLVDERRFRTLAIVDGFTRRPETQLSSAYWDFIRDVIVRAKSINPPDGIRTFLPQIMGEAYS